ncbi:hypothetical protein G4B88_000716 [Cannabis sativa]|uniref:Reverse transcriptase zinc-binding domain-containing protein n=1 Tax=Cannabis sativa TaxID=3483 RepID=A0A7J6ER42_CANSA|nr:hypothetical protein G4B88_000716 [Cannabis sativa]
MVRKKKPGRRPGFKVAKGSPVIPDLEKESSACSHEDGQSMIFVPKKLTTENMDDEDSLISARKSWAEEVDLQSAATSHWQHFSRGKYCCGFGHIMAECRKVEKPKEEEKKQENKVEKEGNDDGTLAVIEQPPAATASKDVAEATAPMIEADAIAVLKEKTVNGQGEKTAVKTASGDWIAPKNFVSKGSGSTRRDSDKGEKVLRNSFELCRLRTTFSESKIVEVGGEKFNVSMLYRSMLHQDAFSAASAIWSSLNVPKHVFHLWQAAQSKLLTRDMFRRLSIPIPNKNCVVCDSETESHHHIFSQQVLSKLLNWLGFNGYMLDCGTGESSSGGITVSRLRNITNENFTSVVNITKLKQNDLVLILSTLRYIP